MRVLFLSFYFEPDLCAGSFRNTALLKELMAQLPPGSIIDVITTLPSRYSTFTVDAESQESRGCATIYRIPLPVHNSGMVDQSKAFIHFAKEAIRIGWESEYDFVYASSSRLMTASLGAYLSRKLKVPLYLDIRDIFVDTIKDVLPRKLVWAMKPLFSLIEKWSFSRAAKINLVSEGFKSYFERRYPSSPLSFYTNGIDEEFLDVPVTSSETLVGKIPEVVYAGNIGEGQGLHTILPPLAKHFEGKLKFKIIGDGGRRPQLEHALKAAAVTNVELLQPVGRGDLIQAYQHADILFMHLNDYDAFLKVLPSKVFEYAALGKPIWAGVAGYAASFVDQYVSNAAVFKPCELESAVRAFQDLSLSTAPRKEFVDKFSRANIMKEMAADIIRTAGVAKV